MANAATSIQNGAPEREGQTSSRRKAPWEKQQKGWRHKDAVSLLREMILSGELAPGERLGEVAISERLGMSRTPVREAFRTLAVEGIVDLLPNRSVVVSDFDETESMDVFAVLGALEALAGQFACQRIPQEQIDILAKLQQELERQFDELDRSSYTQTNRAIHELIVEGSNNAALILAWRLILPRAERARTLNTIDRRRWAEALQHHREIYSALAARDAPLLSSLMRDHFAKDVIEKIAQTRVKPTKPSE